MLDLPTAKLVVDALNEQTSDAIRTMNEAKRQARTIYSERLRDIMLELPAKDQGKLKSYFEGRLLDWNES